MIVSDTGGGNFQPAPAGPAAVVCCDVHDLGEEDTPWGKKPKIRIYWLHPEKMEDGRPFMLAKKYTPSLGEKANLRKDLEAWRGKAFTDEELQGFDLDRLIGVGVYVNVVHKKSADGTKTYANIASLMPLPAGMEAPIIPPDFERKFQRDQHAPAQNTVQGFNNPAPETSAWDKPPVPDDSEQPPLSGGDPVEDESSIPF